MKIRVLSDLHLEFQEFHYQPMDEDVVVLAGDIHIKHRGVEWARKNIRDKPVLYVAGNHEFYGGAYPKQISNLKEAAYGSLVQVLEKEVVTLDGVSFLGCTLWTDFALLGDPAFAGSQCQFIMTDFKKIRMGSSYSRLWARDLIQMHRKSVRWLRESLNQLPGQRVVITHHAPSVHSLPSNFEPEITAAAYASQLDNLVQDTGPACWIHGHIHHNRDYRIGNCRIVCNPRGYAGEFNPEFRSDWVVDVPG